jgi:hypothetical protein
MGFSGFRSADDFAGEARAAQLQELAWICCHVESAILILPAQHIGI